MKEDFFKHKSVRDLAWVIGSPPLIKRLSGLPCAQVDQVEQWYEAFFPILQKLDQNPSDLLLFLAGLSSRRLGDYFARLVEFWLRLRSDVIHLYSNVQIKDERTIGEFDFIYFSATENQTIHLEVAVKFFLRWELDRKILFLGPNPRDSLKTKLEHLKMKQLRLSEHLMAQQWLADHGFGQPKTAAFIKGYLFYPWSSTYLAVDCMAEVSSHHLRGWWLRYLSPEWNAWLSTYAGQPVKWAVLPKSEWLACFIWTDSSFVALQTFKELIQAIDEHFCGSLNCLLIARMTYQKGTWSESSRGFITSAQWPFPNSGLNISLR